MARRVLTVVLGALLVVAACGATGPSGTAAAPSDAPPRPAATLPGANSTGGPAGELRRTASMTVTRAAHTATALADGRVLITGGCTRKSCEGIVATTELFDPATGMAVPGPDMLHARVGHEAVRLPDDRVLLIGGFGASAVLRSTELFDPVTGIFTPGPDLIEPRASMTAVVLGDGSVLVAAGFNGSNAVMTAELLDPSISATRATGSLAMARTAHATALLLDGRVLVIGGGKPGGATDEVHAGAEIFDPASGTWSTTGAMSVRRHKLAAVTLLDGRVLVVGGSDERDSRGRYRTSEVYDPATGTFTPSGDLATARYKLIDAVERLVDGRVLIAGDAPRAELFDPATGQFALVDGDVSTDYRFAAAARLLDGSIVVTGGYDGSINLTAQIVRYVP